MFGPFKKRSSTTLPIILPQTPPLLPPKRASRPEEFWDDNGLGRLVPIYLQLHLASRSPQHTLMRRPDGTIDTDDVPGLMIFYNENPGRQQQIRADFKRLMSEQLPDDSSRLAALTAEEIIVRLSSIYTKVTGEDVYGIVCQKWCAGHKLV